MRMNAADPKEPTISGSIFDMRVLQRILHFIRPYRKQFMGVVVLILIASVLSPLRPYLIQYTLDTHLASGQIDKLLQVILLIFGLLLTQSCVQYFYLYYAGNLGQQVVCDIRVQLYKHVQRLSLRFFNATPVGRLVTRCISDIETLLDVFSQGLASIVSNLLQLFMLFLLIFILDWRLACISLSMLPCMLFVTYVFKERIKKVFNKVRTAVSKLNTFVQEHITGMYIVQVFGVEERAFRNFARINAEQKRAHVHAVLHYSIYFPIVELLQAISLSLLLWYGTGKVLQEELTLGILIAFIMYLQMIFRPIRMIADQFNTLQLGLVSAHRVFALLDTDEKMPDTGKKRADGLRGELAFEQVCFAYGEDGNKHVLHNISFSVRPNQMVALVGETGSGKTTTVHLLSRLHDIQSGCITLDGVDVRMYNLAALRKQIAFVPQEVFLFSDTIRNNITLYNPEISDTHIASVAKHIGAWDFIQQLPDGLNYQVMERGIALSVGERQFIAFIRAMVYNPRVLILDEATSSIDNQTEDMIQAAMPKLMKGRTSLVVAHRLSTIQDADNILVFEQGQIIERGTHDKLIKKRGSYYKLHQMQYKNPKA